MILIDTSGFFAVLNAEDANNEIAKDFWYSLLQSNETMLCNSYVLLETLSLLQSRIGLIAVQDFHENIKPLLRIEWLSEAEHDSAMQLLLSANRRHLSLVDISAFATMRRLGIKKVFTFDKHFAEQGFELLPAS